MMVFMHSGTLLPFPKSPAPGALHKEPTMVHEISRDQVTFERLFETITMAGFEAEIQEDDIFIRGTGCGVRLEIHSGAGVVQIRAVLVLNKNLTDPAAEALCGDLNKRLLVSKFVAHRWDDGDIGLFISYSVHYNFGLNVPNFLFVLRRFIESCQAIYRNEIEGTRLDPDFKPPELELVAPADETANASHP
jgi:hypothetical protein